MKHNKVLFGATLGGAGAILGVLSVLIDKSALGLVAGLCALACAGWAVTAGRASVVTKLAKETADLEMVAAKQIQARLDAETKLATLESRSLEDEERRSVNRIPPVASQALREPETNLFSEAYFGVAVTMRIAAARRHLRPVALALLDVVEGGRTDNPTSADPMLVAERIRSTLREADTACRMDDGRFAIMLEDTPESGAVWTIERVRRAIADENPDLTLWAGLACYPAHAFDADEVVSRASEALLAARDWHQDRIEVAVVE